LISAALIVASSPNPMQHRIPSLRLGRWQIDATVELAAVPMPFAEFLPPRGRS
jgi:hypothetical protein